MDLAAVYRSMVRKYFPNAVIVADRFHVIRLVKQHFLACWREIAGGLRASDSSEPVDSTHASDGDRCEHASGTQLLFANMIFYAKIIYAYKT